MFFIDVQGTLIDDRERKPIPGAVEAIARLDRHQIPYILITNNTKSPSQEFLNYLRNLGFAVTPERYIDPLMVLREVLSQNRIAAYGVEVFLRTLRSLGYELDYEDPEAVVVSVKDDYSFEEFGDIDEFLLRGARLFGMHGTSIYAKEKRYPGVGALLAMFEYATGVKGEVVGKPSELFYKKALDRLGVRDFTQVTIISDDPKGDLVGAKKLGMRTVFVLSGKFRSTDEVIPTIPAHLRPDMVYPTVAEALKELT